MKLLSWFAFCSLGILSGTVTAQDDALLETAPEAEEKDWLEYYYLKPSPDRLVAEVNQWAKDGTIENKGARPAIIGFLSQVFRQNRDKIEDWYGQFSDLSTDGQRIIHTAMFLSRTTEADAILRKKMGPEFDKQKEAVPKILDMNLAQQNTLDMLWGFFYATGSKNAIRRIIWSFQFDDAPDNPEFANVPKDYQPLYKNLPDGAAETLVANAIRHPRVVEICETLYEDKKELVPTERRWVEKVLKAVNSAEDSGEPEA